MSRFTTDDEGLSYFGIRNLFYFR